MSATAMTLAQIAQTRNIKPDTLRVTMKRHNVGVKWGINRELTAQEEADIWRFLDTRQTGRTDTAICEQADSESDTDTEISTETDEVTDTDAEISTHGQYGQGQTDSVRYAYRHHPYTIPKPDGHPVQTPKRHHPATTAFLWLVLALSVSCSVPNMYTVMIAIKGNDVLASLVTAAFTIAPFLLIAAGVRGLWYGVVYAVIGVEIFCNTAGFYGGMTGLEHSLYTAPTLFLHMVTSMTNSANEPTALLLAGCFAVCIALLAVAPVVELKKRMK